MTRFGRSVPSGRRVPVLCLVATVAAAVYLYYPTLFGGFLWDDWAELENAGNRTFAWWVASMSPLSGYYRPVYWLGWDIQLALFGLNPVPYHVVHVLIHLLNVGLVYVAAKDLSDSRRVGGIAAFLFACHPALLGSVGWNTGNTDTLALSFALPTLLAHRAFVSRERTSYGFLALTLLFFYLALKSKLMAVTLPGLLLLHDAVFLWPIRLDRRRLVRRLTLAHVPLWALTVVYLWAFVNLHQGLPTESGYDVSLAPANYLQSIGWYLRPVLLHLVPEGQGLVLASILPLTLAIALIARSRVMLFGWLWFPASLAPVAVLVSHHFELHLYLPLFGAALYAAAGLHLLANCLPWPRARPTLILATLGLYFLADAPHFVAYGNNAQQTWSRSQLTLGRLKEAREWLPPNSVVIVFPRPPAGLFATGAAVRFLYDEPTLVVRVAENRDEVELMSTPAAFLYVFEYFRSSGYVNELAYTSVVGADGVARISLAPPDVSPNMARIPGSVEGTTEGWGGTFTLGRGGGIARTGEYGILVEGRPEPFTNIFFGDRGSLVCEPDTTYRISVWVKGISNFDGVTVAVLPRAENGEFVFGDSSVPLSSEWRRIDHRFRTLPDQHSCVIMIAKGDTTQPASFAVDDLEFRSER